MIRTTILLLLATLSGIALAGGSPCVEDSTNACLDGGRFRVSARFDGNGAQYVPPTPALIAGDATQTTLFDNTAAFSFFGSGEQIDLVVKVLDGCPINARYWVFAALPTDSFVELTVEDTTTGAIRQYVNPAGQPAPAVTDTNAFDSCPARPSGDGKAVPTSTAKGVCPHAVCMVGGRFGLDAAYSNFGGFSGNAMGISDPADRSGLLWFFNPTNVEVAATVVDGTTDNGSFWFLVAAMTDVAIDYTLTDTSTGLTNTYAQSLGLSRTQLDRGDPIDASFMSNGAATPGGPAYFTLQLDNDNSGSRDFRTQVATPAGASNPRFSCTATAPASCPSAMGTGEFDQTGRIPGGGALTYRVVFDLPVDAVIGSEIPVDATTTTLANALAADRVTSNRALLAVAQGSVAIVSPNLVPATGYLTLLIVFVLLGLVGLLQLNRRMG